eukprot:6182912-Pleurochrysis_carterae.AAC.1
MSQKCPPVQTRAQATWGTKVRQRSALAQRRSVAAVHAAAQRRSGVMVQRRSSALAQQHSGAVGQWRGGETFAVAHLPVCACGRSGTGSRWSDGAFAWCIQTVSLSAVPLLSKFLLPRDFESSSTVNDTRSAWTTQRF